MTENFILKNLGFGKQQKKTDKSVSKPTQQVTNKYKKGKFNMQKILLYYSTFIITISFLGGILSTKQPKDVFLNLLFLPVVVFFWTIIIKLRRKK